MVEDIKRDQNIILDQNNLPQSVSTLLCAKILISIDRVAPTNKKQLVSMRFAKSTVEKKLRDFIDDELIRENFFMYSLTKKGELIKSFLLDEPEVRGWLDQMRRFKDQLSRPTIEKIQ